MMDEERILGELSSFIVQLQSKVIILQLCCIIWELGSNFVELRTLSSYGASMDDVIPERMLANKWRICDFGTFDIIC